MNEIKSRMLSPQQKAKELVRECELLFDIDTGQVNDDEKNSRNSAITIALKIMGELMDMGNRIGDSWMKEFEYWAQVRDEIKKL